MLLWMGRVGDDAAPGVEKALGCSICPKISLQRLLRW